MVAKNHNYRVVRQAAPGFRPLVELLPLQTPLSLMVDPSNICNLKCAFCPTGNEDLLQKVGRSKGMLSFDLFRKIIDDLADFPGKLQVLHLYKDGEPLANRALAQMVAYARQSGRVERIEFTSNGLLLSPERSVELLEAGLDGIRISVYGFDDASYRNITRTKVSFERIRANVAALHEAKTRLRPSMHIHCKIVDAGFPQDAKARFLALFSPISDSVHIDPLVEWMPSGAAPLVATPLVRQPAPGLIVGPMVCAEPFMKLAVNHDGSVSVCCADWSCEVLAGDVSKQSLAEIWHGPALRELRLIHLRGERASLPACRNCTYVACLPPQSNLDAHMTELASKYAN